MSARPRVCFLGHCAQLSGAEIALRRLLPALDADPVVVLGEPGPLVEALRADGVETHVVALPRQLAGFRRGSRLRDVVTAARALAAFLIATRRVVAASGVDLVHTNSMKAHLYGGLIARSLGLPVVWHVRDRLTPDYLGRSLSRLVRLLARVLPHVVLAPSRSTAATVGRRDVVVVPDNQDLRPGPAAPAVPPVRPDAAVVGLVGRLSPWKGQHVLLEALGRHDDRWRCRLIGAALFDDAEYEARLRKQAAVLTDEHGTPRVAFRGFRGDVAGELAELDVVVHASTIPEPFGQVVLEAMAAGVPVVAAAAGGPAEVITHGVDGLLVATDDPTALAAALDALGDPNLRRRLRDAALVTAARYTPAHTARGVLEAYDRLPARSRRFSRDAASDARPPRALAAAAARQEQR